VRLTTKLVAETMTQRRFWMPEEHDRLVVAVMDHGARDWVRIAQPVGRDSKSCRDHWRESISKLNRKRWTSDEEKELVWLVEDKKTEKIPWTFIATTLGTGRSGHQCQYKYKTITQKKEKVAVRQAKVLLNPSVRPDSPPHSESEPDWLFEFSS
jgi:hypothetical protein